MILLIDNYDSFVHNLARYLRRLGQETVVVRNDAVGVEDVRAARPDAIVLSPGPCTPREAGCSVDVVREMWQEVPILGVCLGHQAIADAFGCSIIRAPQPMHGRTSPVWHNGRGVFSRIPNPVTVCRYHSLIVDASTLPDQLQPTAETQDGILMALQHRDAPIVGLQFHPEAILTEYGYAMLANFLRIAALDVSPLPMPGEELDEPARSTEKIPDIPITF